MDRKGGDKRTVDAMAPSSGDRGHHGDPETVDGPPSGEFRMHNILL